MRPPRRLRAVEVCLRTGIVGVGGRQRGAGILDRELVVGRIEASDELAGRQDGADIDIAAHDLAGDTKPSDASMEHVVRPG